MALLSAVSLKLKELLLLLLLVRILYLLLQNVLLKELNKLVVLQTQVKFSSPQSLLTLLKTLELYQYQLVQRNTNYRK